MKTNLRGKIREFVQSEEGKVGVKFFHINQQL